MCKNIPKFLIKTYYYFCKQSHLDDARSNKIVINYYVMQIVDVIITACQETESLLLVSAGMDISFKLMAKPAVSAHLKHLKCSFNTV